MTRRKIPDGPGMPTERAPSSENSNPEWTCVWQRIILLGQDVEDELPARCPGLRRRSGWGRSWGRRGSGRRSWLLVAVKVCAVPFLTATWRTL